MLGKEQWLSSNLPLWQVSTSIFFFLIGGFSCHSLPSHELSDALLRSVPFTFSALHLGTLITRMLHSIFHICCPCHYMSMSSQWTAPPLSYYQLTRLKIPVSSPAMTEPLTRQHETAPPLIHQHETELLILSLLTHLKWLLFTN